MSGRTILIVLRTSSVRELLAEQFRAEGVTPVTAGNAAEGAELFAIIQPDAVVLDLDDDDWEVVWNDVARRPAREAFFLVALTRSRDSEPAIRLRRAPHVVCRSKPFVPRQLVAEVLGKMRSGGVARRTRLVRRLLEAGEVRVGANRRLVESGSGHGGPDLARADWEGIGLASVELRLLKLLVDNSGRSMTREEIVRGLWGSQCHRDARTVDQNVRRLRQRLDEAGIHDFVQTVPGVGYRLVASPGAGPPEPESGAHVT